MVLTDTGRMWRREELLWMVWVAALEAGTAVCAALNFSYFMYRTTLRAPLAVSRRAAAFVLAVISLGALLESTVVLAGLAATEDSVFASEGWALVAAVSFAGMAMMSALVLRVKGDGR